MMRMSRIESYYHALEQLKRPSELLTLLQGITESSNISGFFIARLPTQGEELNPNIALRGWNEQWIEHYARKNYVHDDPIAKELRNRSTPFIWSEVCKHRKLTNLEHQIMREAQAAGLEDGLTVPVLTARRQTTCVSFATTGTCGEDSFDKEGRQTLQLIASMAVTKLEELSLATTTKCEAPPSIRPLAPREQQCLALAGKGLTSRQIERQIGLTFRTVDFYIGRAMQKLNASSRTEALILALKYGIMDP